MDNEAYKTRIGKGNGSYNPTPASGNKGTAFQIPWSGTEPAIQGNEYAQAAAHGDMANAIANQAVAGALAGQMAPTQAQSRYDQLMQDYALSQMADGAAVQRYMAQQPAQYGEDIGALYDMLYGRN